MAGTYGTIKPADIDIENEYNELLERFEYLSDKIKIMPNLENDYKEIMRDVNEEIMCFKHLLTREEPYLYVAPNKDFYNLDNKKDNEDIKILKYSSLPSIKMPVAQ